MAAVAVLPETCPRCGRPLIRNWDERECLTHGLVHTPVRAWDAAQSAREDFLYQGGAGAWHRRRSDSRIPRVSAEETAALAAVERGDPDALDEDEWDAALSGLNHTTGFTVRPRCEQCGKRAMVNRRCRACWRLAS